MLHLDHQSITCPAYDLTDPSMISDLARRQVYVLCILQTHWNDLMGNNMAKRCHSKSVSSMLFQFCICYPVDVLH